MCFRTEKYFPLVIRLTLDTFKGYLPLCHCERLQRFIVSERCAVNMELISVCTRDLTIPYSQHTCGLALHHVHSESFVMRKHQICCAHGVYAENALAVWWMYRRDVWYMFCRAILPTPCSVFLCCRASNTEQALPKKSMFPENYRVSWAAWHRNWWVNGWSCRFTQNLLQKYMCC